MKYDLKTPCKDCPFIKGSSTNTTLAPTRIPGIIKDLRNNLSFECHKTSELEASKVQHCAGALIFLERENKPHQMMRIAERMGMYDYKKLDMEADIIDR